LGGVATRLVENICRLASITTNKEAGRYSGLVDEAVYRVQREYLRFLLLRRSIPFQYRSI
jgi:hypothetical protein